MCEIEKERLCVRESESNLIRVKIEPDKALLGLKMTQTRNGVKIDPDEKWG